MSIVIALVLIDVISSYKRRHETEPKKSDDVVISHSVEVPQLAVEPEQSVDVETANGDDKADAVKYFPNVPVYYGWRFHVVSLFRISFQGRF